MKVSSAVALPHLQGNAAYKEAERSEQDYSANGQR
jgi:hypothetical protein